MCSGTYNPATPFSATMARRMLHVDRCKQVSQAAAVVVVMMVVVVLMMVVDQSHRGMDVSVDCTKWHACENRPTTVVPSN